MSPITKKGQWLQRLQKKFNIPGAQEYETLPDIDFIRILEILPGKENDQIRCRLHVTTLAEAENTYDAISYVWGDPGELATILINKKPVDININLADALRAIRHPKKAKRVWADAVCINQRNETEKGHHVKRMGRVYESAQG